jgi:hypothetical protein
MSAFRFAFVLVVALAACTDQTLSTAPPDDPPGRALTPSFTTGNQWSAYLWRFTRLTSLPRATANASGLPASGVFCTSSESRLGEWQIQLSPGQIASLLSAVAAGATVAVHWETYTQFHFGGYKNVREGGTLYDGTGRTMFDQPLEQNVDPYIDGAGTGKSTDAYYTLTPAEVSELTVGSILRVTIWGTALAWVHDDDCAIRVSGAQALWRIGSEPALFVSYLPDPD